MDTQKLGDDYLLRMLKARLNSSGKSKSKDQYGNEVCINCDIFSKDQLVIFLEMSLHRFNLFFDKELHFGDDPISIHKFADLIVQGAVITALASKALLECGREFSMQNDGVVFTPPAISSLLMHQWEVELTDYDRKVKFLLDRYDFS